MAITVKLQRYEQTELTKGFGDARADSLVVYARVEGLNGTNNAAQNLEYAANYAVSQAGTTAAAFGEPTYYLIAAAPSRVTDEKFDVHIRYGRPMSAPPILPGTANVEEVIEWVFDTTVGTSFYSYTPYPFTGPPIDTTTYFPIIRPSPIARLRLTTVLSAHPGTAVDLLVGSTNGDVFTFGRPRAINTVRMDGAQIQPIPVYGTSGTTPTIKYHVVYEASYKKNTWSNLRFFFGAFPGTATAPAPEYVNQYGTISFTNVLPLHG